MKKHKPEITYPCEWIFKIIGTEEKLLCNAVDNIINDRLCQISHSKTSKTGKYISLNVKLTLLSEEDRNNFYTEFSNHKDIKLVL